MKIFLFVFALIILKILYDPYHNDIKGPEQTVLALICAFFCDMFFGEYLLICRQRRYAFGDIEKILKNNDGDHKCE